MSYTAQDFLFFFERSNGFHAPSKENININEIWQTFQHIIKTWNGRAQPATSPKKKTIIISAWQLEII